VKLDVEGIKSYIEGRRVMITGAGGSIGSELCRQIVPFNPNEIILLDASEGDLYTIQTEMDQVFSYQKQTSVLGSVRNREIMGKTLTKFSPGVVFHAAAYKHVPMLELNPWQAVLNNIKGTQVLMEECLDHQVGTFVLVSTDKAVRPTNVMGASKRICEMLLQSYAGGDTRMSAVRFGNVVGSSGSVIKLFRDQIRRGGPVTVTHPDVTRFFMTIPEACQLILQCGTYGKNGELFILEMGTAVKVTDMARDLITLSGKDPDKDIEITFTGLRPGEKLYEELITEGEGIVPTEHDKILVLSPNGDWNGHGSQEAYRNHLLAGIQELTDLANAHDACGIKDKLHDLIPEYTPQDTDCVF